MEIQNNQDKQQKIIVFQQNESGKLKIDGLKKFGKDLFDLNIVNIDDILPPVIDDTSEILPSTLFCDLVLDFLRHGDLSTDLAALCQAQGIPYIGSGKKVKGKNIFTPPTCCGLPRNELFGNYGELFGAPSFEVEQKDGIVTEVRVIRGAPCGATWHVAKRLIGHSIEDASRKIGLETQFYCYADPSGWDPIHGKSPVHFAGKVHSKQVQKAIDTILSLL